MQDLAGKTDQKPIRQNKEKFKQSCSNSFIFLFYLFLLAKFLPSTVKLERRKAGEATAGASDRFAEHFVPEMFTSSC